LTEWRGEILVKRRFRLIAASFFWFLLSFALILGATETLIDGTWDGAILVRPAEIEVGLELSIINKMGHLEGSVVFSTQGSASQPLSAIDIDGQAVQIIYKAPDGDASTFQGSLSNDRQEIKGTVLDGGKTIPFELRKVERPVTAPPLVELSNDGAELRTRFAADRKGVRLLLILSPTCVLCRNNARLVNQYVLKQVSDPRLRVLVVWERIASDDSATVARDASRLLDDPRVTHYWSDHRFVGTSFQKALGTQTSPPWDVVLIFDPESDWSNAARAPQPRDFMHSLKSGELPDDKKFNGFTLQRTVAKMLEANGSEAPDSPAKKTGETVEGLVARGVQDLGRPGEGRQLTANDTDERR
jgi:hypothetical protein